MCIFNGPVESVSRTKIFVAPVNKNTQVTVYTNQVSLVNNGQVTAMILPFPNPNRESNNVKMIDMTAYKDGKFFEKLNSAFPSSQGMFRGAKGLSFSNSRGMTDSLEVLDCGSYQYSVAPTLADLQRVRSDVFRLSDRVQQVLSQHYAANYGFLVCILKRSGSYSPIAYTSPMANGKLFIPTRHEHGDSHTNLNYPGYSLNGTSADQLEFADDWDHDIYVLGTIDKSNPLGDSTAATTKVKDVLKEDHELTKLVGHLGREYFFKWRIHGRQKNCDLSAVSLFALDSCKCSFEVSGKQYITQPWFNCIECKLVNGLGCCLGCAMTCHKGHTLVPQGISQFFCDCRLESRCSFGGVRVTPAPDPVQVGTRPLIKTSDMCLQSYPCQHGVTVTYYDGSTRNLGHKYGDYVYWLYRHMGYEHGEIPDHFRGYHTRPQTAIDVPNVPDQISIPEPVRVAPGHPVPVRTVPHDGGRGEVWALTLADYEFDEME